MRPAALGWLLIVLAALTAPPAFAQESAEARLRQEQQRLEQIRRERAELEQRMRQLQGSAHDLAEEVRNLDRQADATARLVRSLVTQLASINEEVERATVELDRTENELYGAHTALRRRVIQIYKRGPLYTWEVLLTADNFAQLLARYKYLRLLTDRDKRLIGKVQSLRDATRRQRANLVMFQQQIELARQEKASEEQRLRSLEQQRGRSLAAVRRQTRQLEQRLASMKRDEARLNNVIASLEATRRRGGAAGTPSTLRTADLGNLDWPVHGSILYSFGRVVNPNNTTTRWNGIGIATAAGTAVSSVSAGQVVVAEPFGTYGLTVIVQHGGGDYSVYGSLGRLAVQKGARVSKGETIGFVGSADPDLPPHLHFEIRPNGRAVDPLEWLRGR
ncbi:MAG TPA: peptidoglycan DD-metalloendopeptidase family protein [Gemmatimonadaceae bacterium]|nr:peptidoglycan DD-metalloendopeptidase family protein [Gemmatimonadaceae bacterium]